MKAKLEALNGRIPGLRSLRLGADLASTDGHWDCVLISEHDDAAALQGYQVHPDHVLVKDWLSDYVADRATVDFAS